MKPFISSYAYIPYDMLGEHKSRFSSDTRVNIKNALTHVPTKFMEDGKETRITAYDDTSYPTHLGVPLEWALKPGRYDHLPWEDKTCMGTMRLKAKKEIDPYHEQAPEGQAEFIQGILKVLEERISCLATADTGCHTKGTKIIKHDGTLVNVEDVRVGDYLMGEDSQPKLVTKLYRGHGEIYEVKPSKGQSFRCNSDHVLRLQLNTSDYLGDGSNRVEYVNITIREYLRVLYLADSLNFILRPYHGMLYKVLPKGLGIETSSFTITRVEDDNFYGFTVEDSLYLLEDFTVTHNSGKSPVGLAVASRIGLRTLIVVDQINLADQWKQEAINLLGMNPNHVAIVQGKGGFNMTAPICIATIQSIRKGTALYPKKFYESFGFWIFDEVHIMGAATFSEAFKYCYGAFRLGLTATDERKDGSDKVYKWFLGQPRVKAEGKSMDLKAFVHNYSNGGKYPFGNNLSIHISHLSKDKNRNKFITGLVLEAYNRGRHILVIGDRIPQLEDIKERLINLGVSSKDVGLYTGSATQANGKRKILKEKDVKSILKDCRIVLATYKKAEKGLNVPRLDWGIDITPRGKGVQVTGRVRRLMKGKPLPEWHTIRDEEYPAFCGMCNSRVWEYKKKGFDVEFIG